LKGVAPTPNPGSRSKKGEGRGSGEREYHVFPKRTRRGGGEGTRSFYTEKMAPSPGPERNSRKPRNERETGESSRPTAGTNNDRGGPSQELRRPRKGVQDGRSLALRNTAGQNQLQGTGNS